MADDGAQYKNMSVKTMRGLEARSRAKWEKDGWEFVSQDQVSRLRSELTFRRLKKKQPWYLWPAIAGGVLLVVGLFVIAGVLKSGEDSGSTQKAVPAAVSTPASTPTSTPTATATPSPTVTAPRPLDETTAAQFLAMQWEAKFTYGGKVQWVMDRITTPHPDGTFTFKLSATVTNQYGTDQQATIEGDVGGTDAAPTITDSILYTADGQIVNFSG
ncbi:hypothetical protein [Frigoribacterium sp. UYMn621]|uniref:hypothetical protein n=1 Tax=Frigoribacterium sp. UYMn621 TaxID=3156343 RepID=UPI0033926297